VALDVVMELKVPQDPAGAHEKVTPAFAESPETATAMFAAALRPMEAGGAVEKETEMLLMLTVAWADLVASVMEVAMMVTEPPVGAEEGEL